MVGVTKCNLQKSVICRYKDVLIYFQGEQHNHGPQPSPVQSLHFFSDLHPAAGLPQADSSLLVFQLTYCISSFF